MGLAFCGALFLCAAKLAKVLQRNCNIDDMTAETIGFAAEKIREAGVVCSGRRKVTQNRKEHWL